MSGSRTEVPRIWNGVYFTASGTRHVRGVQSDETTRAASRDRRQIELDAAARARQQAYDKRDEGHQHRGAMLTCVARGPGVNFGCGARPGQTFGVKP